MTLLRGLMDLLIGDFINNALIRNMCPLRDLSGTELFSTRVQTLLNHQVFRSAIKKVVQVVKSTVKFYYKESEIFRLGLYQKSINLYTVLTFYKGY